ncbi:UNVERIFIED_CONTAM: hypothetical protein Sradi_3319900 [Sesamum radiatum]|uniref:Uncharacterized protein n=1 Tax=Sesamum radiatum TaxID=300843 RepID=A0AAW2R1T0_SESRA
MAVAKQRGRFSSPIATRRTVPSPSRSGSPCHHRYKGDGVVALEVWATRLDRGRRRERCPPSPPLLGQRGSWGKGAGGGRAERRSRGGVGGGGGRGRGRLGGG